MRLIHAADTHVIVTDAYVLWLRDGIPAAALFDPDGRMWTDMCLFADVDRTDLVDESFGLDLRVADGGTVVDVVLEVGSSSWLRKSVRLRCFDDRLELTVTVEGSGTLADVRLLGGRAILPRGTGGTYRSSIRYASVFNPTPTEPVAVVRPASSAITLGIVGDAAPGRLHAVFSPPPLCLALGRTQAEHATHVPDGDWLAVGVLAGVDELRFTELRYAPVDGGFLLELDYDGHTTVNGAYTSPVVIMRPTADPWRALTDYRSDLISRGLAPDASRDRPGWWSEPIFCGWGAQRARVLWPNPTDDWPPQTIGADLARQTLYDEWLTALSAHGVVPGTIVVDDRWQSAYGTGEPDLARWPDLRLWIKSRHAAGQRVLLWWKAWDPEGLPQQECVVDPTGAPVAADPGSPAYRTRLTRIVSWLLGPDGLDADGFKIDFTQWAPSGRLLRRPGASLDAPWGIAALHTLLHTIYRAAKAAKPDALIVTHTPHPCFADVTDAIRLNDILRYDVAGALVPAADQLAFRHRVATSALPGHLVDTDQWPLVDRATWRAYVTAQPAFGVPALYYVDRIDCSGEPLTPEDLALVAETWQTYRDSGRYRRDRVEPTGK